MVSAPAVRIDARVPQQSRSRKRRENILSAANALIAQHGILGLRMNDVAKLAQVPIGSVYQYFPTKSVLVACLFSRQLDFYHGLGRRYLREVRRRQDVASKLRRLVTEVYEDNRSNVLMQEVWAGVQADRTIRKFHLQDNEFFVDLFVGVLRRARSAIPESLLRRRCQVVNEMWDGTIRLAITLERKEGDALVKESIDLGLANLGLARSQAAF